MLLHPISHSTRISAQSPKKPIILCQLAISSGNRLTEAPALYWVVSTQTPVFVFESYSDV